MNRNGRDGTEQTSPLGLAAWEVRPAGMARAHRHGDLELNYVLSGEMTYLVGGRLVTLPVERLCVLWGAIPHQLLSTERPAAVLMATVPLTRVLGWGLPEALLRPLLAEGLVIDPVARASDRPMLDQWLTELGPPDGIRSSRAGQETAHQRPALLELEARLRRLGQALAAAPAADQPAWAERVGKPGERGLAAVQRMAGLIAEQYTEPLSVEAVARAASLHPNYAMSLFRRHTGMTITAYRNQQRLAHAQRLLATTDRPILDIALASGFQSLSRFYEAFRQQMGQSPRQFRAELERPRG